jgi:hypothetical protein
MNDPIHDFCNNSISHTMSSAHNYRVTKPTQRTPTCDMCRSRHQKCGAEQPQCSNCRLRGINCSYSSSKTRVPETKRSPETTFALPFVPSISQHSSLGKDPTNHLLDRAGRRFQMPTTTASTQRYSATSCVIFPLSSNRHHT